jgi:serine/threonine kinase 16
MSFILSCFDCECWGFLSSFISSKSIHFKKSGLSITIENQILGEGAYSIVYKAKGNKNNQYAIKKMFIQSREYDKIVQDEIDALLRFSHPNIIKMIDSNNNITHNDTKIAYILFPFIPNGSLRNILNKNLDRLKNRQNLRIILKDFVKLCGAFNVLHKHSPSYVHQDIKPENILISDNGI